MEMQFQNPQSQFPNLKCFPLRPLRTLRFKRPLSGHKGFDIQMHWPFIPSFSGRRGRNSSTIPVSAYPSR